jgi:N-methylhydantoinase A
MAQLNSTHALQTIHSGPTSGINVAEQLSDELDTGKLITLDMGGTSCDIGLVVGGGIKFYDFNPTIDRWLVNIPMLHLKIIGAGGGSIATYNQMFNSIEVGPTSAGSDPGPACYDRGGMDPTVSDSDLLLGYLDPDHYAGGNVKLNQRRSQFTVEENISDEMDISVTDAAKQIKQKVDTNMAHAIFQELGVKGYDPKDFTLLAYGGNGPLHACGIAEVLGIDKILVPPFSSIFSAVGAGIMNQLHIHERNVFINIYDSNTRSLFEDYETFNLIVEELKNAGKEDLLRQGMSEESIQFRLELDMRYGNQRAETSVISPVSSINNLDDVIGLIQAFSQNYGERFGEGSQSPEAGIRINTIRVISYVELESISFNQDDDQVHQLPQPKRRRHCHFVGHNESISTPVYFAEDIHPGTVLVGPALIESPRTTYLVELGWEIKIGHDNLAWITRQIQPNREKRTMQVTTTKQNPNSIFVKE